VKPVSVRRAEEVGLHDEVLPLGHAPVQDGLVQAASEPPLDPRHLRAGQTAGADEDGGEPRRRSLEDQPDELILAGGTAEDVLGEAVGGPDPVNGLRGSPSIELENDAGVKESVDVRDGVEGPPPYVPSPARPAGRPTGSRCRRCGRRDARDPAPARRRGGRSPRCPAGDASRRARREALRALGFPRASPRGDPGRARRPAGSGRRPPRPPRARESGGRERIRCSYARTSVSCFAPSSRARSRVRATG
jgi:hypothetical protein